MYDEFKSITDEQAPHFIEGLENEKVRFRIKELVGGCTVLDAGCGRGIDAKLYRPNQYVGLDISHALINEAKKVNPDHVFICHELGDFLINFQNEFDYIICHSVLEHQPDEQTALTLFNLMLSKCDVLLVAWHMIPKDKTEIKQVKGHFGKDCYQNDYSFNLFQLQGINIKKEIVDNYELWHVTKV